MFSCEFCEFSKNIFFTEHLRATASVVYSFIILITHSTFGINPIFYYSGLVIIPSVDALFLCCHHRSLCFSFQTHNTKSMMGAAWPTSACWLHFGCRPCRGLFSQVSFICWVLLSLWAFLLISFACSVYKRLVSFVWSCRLNSCLNVLLCFEIECAFFAA